MPVNFDDRWTVVAVESKFNGGNIFVTHEAQQSVPGREIFDAICRHLMCDWGDIGKRAKAENDAALKSGRRLLSAYRTTAGVRFWIMTEADRSETTVFLRRPPAEAPPAKPARRPRRRGKRPPVHP